MKIFVEFDGDKYILMCLGRGMGAMPAGPRLYRARPHPEIDFSHDTMEAANSAAEALTTYIDRLTTKKLSKKELREQHD
jgi:hypothetical protein